MSKRTANKIVFEIKTKMIERLKKKKIRIMRRSDKKKLNQESLTSDLVPTDFLFSSSMPVNYICFVSAEKFKYLRRQRD